MRVGFVHVINHMMADLRMKLGSAHKGSRSWDRMPFLSSANQWEKCRHVMGEREKKSLYFIEPENLSCFCIIPSKNLQKQWSYPVYGSSLADWLRLGIVVFIHNFDQFQRHYLYVGEVNRTLQHMLAVIWGWHICCPLQVQTLDHHPSRCCQAPVFWDTVNIFTWDHLVVLAS